MNDYYKITIINPKKGDRVIINGATVEMEIKNNFNEDKDIFGRIKASVSSTYLDIVMAIPKPKLEVINELKKSILQDKLFLYFEDVHPNLISGRVTGLTQDHEKITIRFVGNSTNKTYLDYITETANEFNKKALKNPAYLPLESPGDPIDNGIVEPSEELEVANPKAGQLVFKKKVKFRKDNKRKDDGITILKRKLTF